MGRAGGRGAGAAALCPRRGAAAPATLGGDLLSYLGGVYREGEYQVGLLDLPRLERALEEALR